MTHRVASKLASAEWDFAKVDAALTDLARLLHECAEEAPECVSATLAVQKIRKRLFGSWKSVEYAVTAAQQMVETIQAPF